MLLKQFIVDAFVKGPFSGNPAAVVPLEEWPDDHLMQAIAAENNLSETAFFVPASDQEPIGGRGRVYELRWFTPTTEVDLCGHATLATAHVLARELDSVDDGGWIAFETRSGRLEVDVGIGEYAMTLPAVMPKPADDDGSLAAALGVSEEIVLSAMNDRVVVCASSDSVRGCDPDMNAIARLEIRAVCLTAPSDSDEFDFCTRVFAPAVGIDEDPATGSAQCALGPYWVERLGGSPVRCEQLSKRGAALTTHWQSDDRSVTVIGRCSTFSRGELSVAH